MTQSVRSVRTAHSPMRRRGTACAANGQSRFTLASAWELREQLFKKEEGLFFSPFKFRCGFSFPFTSVSGKRMPLFAELWWRLVCVNMSASEHKKRIWGEGLKCSLSLFQFSRKQFIKGALCIWGGLGSVSWQTSSAKPKPTFLSLGPNTVAQIHHPVHERVH